MPGDVWSETQKLAGCALVVAAGAVPVGLLGRWLARRLREPVLPRWKPWRVPWTGLEVTLAFLGLMMVVPPVVLDVLDRAGYFPAVYGPEHQAADFKVVRMVWAGVLSLPVQLGFALLVWFAAYPRWRPPGRLRQTPGRVWLGVVAWAVISAAVYPLHLGITQLFNHLGWPTAEHELTRLAGRPAFDQTLFVLDASVCAPLGEELLFRGILLPWLVGGAALGGGRPNRSLRVWGVLAAGVLMAAASVRGAPDATSALTRGPVLFAAALAAGWGVVSLVLRRKRRTAGAVYASAALFAAIHSAVWPSPIPLFVLGLGLGWVAVRTRGFLVPALIHGLFNAVSVVLVLRGG